MDESAYNILHEIFFLTTIIIYNPTGLTKDYVRSRCNQVGSVLAYNLVFDLIEQLICQNKDPLDLVIRL